MMRILVSIILCTHAMLTAAQSFYSVRELSLVETDGFYKIELSPEIISELNAAMSNIRLMDAAGKEIPYLLRQEQPATYSKTFRPYRIVQYDKVKKCCTTIVLENPDNKSINNIHLSIRNADVTKTMTLTGSDDQQNWYALKSRSSISASGVEGARQTSAIRLVDFPLSNYAYYKIEIEDSTSAPLNIMAAGYFAVNAEGGRYSAVPFAWKLTDSATVKGSFIRIRFPKVQVIDRVTLSMKGTPYFLRHGSLLRKSEGLSRGGKSQDERVASFTVSSRQPAVIELGSVRGSDFVLRIENDDNPALQVDNIQVQQLNRYLVAWLSKGQYVLKVGAPELPASHYDLVNFSDSIPANLAILKAGPAKGIEPAHASETGSVFNSPVAIWVAIVAVIGVLGYMAIRMAREM